jgi:hypothetical protein
VITLPSLRKLSEKRPREAFTRLTFTGDVTGRRDRGLSSSCCQMEERQAHVFFRPHTTQPPPQHFKSSALNSSTVKTFYKSSSSTTRIKMACDKLPAHQSPSSLSFPRRDLPARMAAEADTLNRRVALLDVLDPSEMPIPTDWVSIYHLRRHITN